MADERSKASSHGYCGASQLLSIEYEDQMSSENRSIPFKDSLGDVDIDGT